MDAFDRLPVLPMYRNASKEVGNTEYGREHGNHSHVSLQGGVVIRNNHGQNKNYVGTEIVIICH